MMMMKRFGMLTLLLAAVLSPTLVSARLTLIRLAQGDQTTSKLRGLATRHETTPDEAHVYVYGCELMQCLYFFASRRSFMNLSFSFPFQ